MGTIDSRAKEHTLQSISRQLACLLSIIYPHTSGTLNSYNGYYTIPGILAAERPPTPLFSTLEKHQTHVGGIDGGALPVVNIILQISITNTEQVLLESGLVVHQIQSVEHVDTHIASQDQSVLAQILEWHRCGNVVVGVGGKQVIVFRVRHHSGRKVVEGDQISNFTSAVLAHIRVHNLLACEQHVGQLLHVIQLAQFASKDKNITHKEDKI